MASNTQNAAKVRGGGPADPAFAAKMGTGRKKGVPNKVTRQLKEMIIEALDKAGGVAYLTDRALDQPAAFMTLVGKVLPLQLTGKDDAPIQIEQVENDAAAFTRRLFAQSVAGAEGGADCQTQH